MLARIRKFVAPPVFENDEEKTRVAALLNTILWSQLGVLVAINILFGMVSLFGEQAPQDLAISFVAIAMFSGMLFLVHRGFVRGISYLLAFSITGIITYSIAQSPIVNAATLSGLLIPVMMVGLFAGGRGTLVVTVVNLLILSSLGYFHKQGWVVSPPLPSSDLIAFGAISTTSALLLGLASRSIQQALAHSRQHQQELSALTQALEQRVEDRTKALATSVEVSRRLSTILDERRLIMEVVEQVKAAFDYYHVQIYLLDEVSGNLIMVGGTGDIGAALLKRGHKISKGKGLVGRAAETIDPVLVADTSQDPDWLPNPSLPETSSEAALPILISGNLLGVLDVQHNQVGGLKQTDLDLLQSIANQIAIALLNARSYTEVRQRAEREARIASIGEKIQTTSSIESALQVTVRELGHTLGAHDIRVILEAPNLVQNSRESS
ncbi:MAG TPA: GAF domain-containing protein [Anaerolineales bacterium]|nr:GAF domain-containing protein [Anaerolineales bacterium]